MRYLIILWGSLCFYTATAQQFTPKTAFLEKWTNSKEYLLGIATAMPDSLYAYKPTEREMDFRNQLIHICGNMQWLSTTYFTEQTFDRDAFTASAPTTKETTLAFIANAFDAAYQRIEQVDETTFTEEVDFFAGKKSKLQILNLLQDHVTHHRGQLIVYLNLQKIKPPGYTGW